MKTVSIIGNDFDLGHDLHTTFENFIASIDEVFSKKYKAFRSESNEWNEVESVYEELLCDIMYSREQVEIFGELEGLMNTGKWISTIIGQKPLVQNTK